MPPNQTQDNNQPSQGVQSQNQQSNAMPPPASPDLGLGFGVAALILTIVIAPLAPVALILAIVGYKKSKNVGKKNVVAIIAMILSGILTAGLAMMFIFGFIGALQHARQSAVLIIAMS